MYVICVVITLLMPTAAALLGMFFWVESVQLRHYGGGFGTWINGKSWSWRTMHLSDT